MVLASLNRMTCPVIAVDLCLMVLPRAFSLLDIVGRANQKKLSTAVPYMLNKLDANPDRLRDHRIEQGFIRWRELVAIFSIATAYA
jgi:hypothetical protein